jgi:hypothetical protein
LNRRPFPLFGASVFRSHTVLSWCGDGCFIETDQREQLCPLIIAAAKRAGLVSDVNDITEGWREW